MMKAPGFDPGAFFFFGASHWWAGGSGAWTKLRNGVRRTPVHLLPFFVHLTFSHCLLTQKGTRQCELFVF